MGREPRAGRALLWADVLEAPVPRPVTFDALPAQTSRLVWPGCSPTWASAPTGLRGAPPRMAGGRSPPSVLGFCSPARAGGGGGLCTQGSPGNQTWRHFLKASVRADLTCRHSALSCWDAES